jgi:tetraprenyl-beta-curcumene synthase
MSDARKHSMRELVALVVAGVGYWLTVYPRARLEIRRWRRLADAIPDPTLRCHALHKLTRERLNPEAAALFSVLAPRRRRPVLVRLIVAFQIAYDYLDAINEQPDGAGVRNGLQLHSALRDAVSSKELRADGDYYAHHPQREDGGYLAALVAACRAALRALPGANALEPTLVRAAERCCEAQSRNHAVVVEGEEQLIAWSQALGDRAGYRWWELAAAGISCLALHALFAAAASPTTRAQARRVDAAYFPSVCAISALLDSLIDRPHDAGGTNHSFVAHYPGAAAAAQRFAAIAAEARTLVRGLAGSDRHALILAGISSFYLSAPEARSELAAPAAASTLACLGATTTPILAVMRWRRSASS